jgi:hypothetical protein
MRDFPGHLLFSLGDCALDLVKRRETKRFIADASQQVAIDEILRTVITHRGQSAKQRILVHTREIQFDEPEDNGSRRISVLVNDGMGRLEDERESILDSLGKVTGARVSLGAFVPRVEIGRVRVEPSADAIESLETFLPGRISLGSVQTYPYSQDIWQFATPHIYRHDS